MDFSCKQSPFFETSNGNLAVKVAYIVKCIRIDEQLPLTNGSINVALLSEYNINKCDKCSSEKNYKFSQSSKKRFLEKISEKDHLLSLNEYSINRYKNIHHESHNEESCVYDIKVEFSDNSERKVSIGNSKV